MLDAERSGTEPRSAADGNRDNGGVDSGGVDSGDKAMIILQTMICYLREKNILSRADIELLRERVETRIGAAGQGQGTSLDGEGPCALSGDAVVASAAAQDMRELDEYCGRRYGGKHRRRVN